MLLFVIIVRTAACILMGWALNYLTHIGWILSICLISVIDMQLRSIIEDRTTVK